jgi:hypothetical protein
MVWVMPAGRPPTYETPEAMQADIDGFFAMCVAEDRPPTISGLAYHLNLSTESLRNYEGKPEFLATVKRAKQRVEVSLEERLHESAPTGAIFNLKNNFGWKDSVHTEHTGSIQVEAIERRIVKTVT